MWLLVFVGLVIVMACLNSSDKSKVKQNLAGMKEKGDFDPNIPGLHRLFIDDFWENFVAKRYIPEKYVPYVAEVADLEHPYDTVLYGPGDWKRSDEKLWEVTQGDPRSTYLFVNAWADFHESTMGFEPTHFRPPNYDRRTYQPYISFFSELEYYETQLKSDHDRYMESPPKYLGEDLSIYMGHENETVSRKPVDLSGLTEIGKKYREDYISKVEHGQFAKAVGTIEDLAGFWLWAFGDHALKTLEESSYYVFTDPDRGIRLTKQQLMPVLEICIVPKIKPDTRDIWNNVDGGGAVPALGDGTTSGKNAEVKLPSYATVTDKPIPDSPSEEEYHKVKKDIFKKIGDYVLVFVVLSIIPLVVFAGSLKKCIHYMETPYLSVQGGDVFWCVVPAIILMVFLFLLVLMVDLDLRYLRKFRKAYRNGVNYKGKSKRRKKDRGSRHKDKSKY